ncbi:MAG TPA: hypothetical protein P5204_12420 [Kiritimatiellia bacterium]|nr:hypothetical protein [Kiritimatiellia bacterium]
MAWKNQPVFSTVWKTIAAAALASGWAAAAEPARLALDLDAEGQREAAAIEFRRLALAGEQAEDAGRWFWLAAHEYSLGEKLELSNQMLDRAEDVAPFALAVPVAWMRAENAMRGQDWASASFHFDSLRLKADADDLREFAARGAAAANLRGENVAGARQALAGAPGDLAEARAAIDRYAGRRDKKPWVGGVLGLVPGLGYVYSGEYANAARSIILNSLFIWGMVETGGDGDWAVFSVLTFAEFTWYSGSIYGGIDSAHRHNQRRLDAAVDEIRGEKPLRPDLAQVPLFSLKFEF